MILKILKRSIFLKTRQLLSQKNNNPNKKFKKFLKKKYNNQKSKKLSYLHGPNMKVKLQCSQKKLLLKIG